MKRRVVLVLLAALALTGAALGWSFMPSPLPAPEPFTGPLPSASPPEGMAIYQLPTGSYQTPAGLAFRGGSFSETRDFAATAVLVRHPKGDLLFDTGFGADVDAQIHLLPSFQQSPYQRGETVRAQLTAAKYDFGALQGVIITHAHWDHVGAAAELGVPVWMNAAEQQYASKDRDDTRVFRSLRDLKIHSYAFDGPPYLGFPSSHDVWGDGSIVLVPAPGHTPGSIVAFITLPAGKRYALIGDLTWQLDGIEKRAERPWMLRIVADADPAQVRHDLLQMVSLKDRMTVIPAHDGRAHGDLPRLQ
jgi:glyoxylase-like metal-dependent hydrolase (beta-lactamase superfamily II)